MPPPNSLRNMPWKCSRTALNVCSNRALLSTLIVSISSSNCFLDSARSATCAARNVCRPVSSSCSAIASTFTLPRRPIFSRSSFTSAATAAQSVSAGSRYRPRPRRTWRPAGRVASPRPSGRSTSPAGPDLTGLDLQPVHRLGQRGVLFGQGVDGRRQGPHGLAGLGDLGRSRPSPAPATAACFPIDRSVSLAVRRRPPRPRPVRSTLHDPVGRLGRAGRSAGLVRPWPASAVARPVGCPAASPAPARARRGPSSTPRPLPAIRRPSASAAVPASTAACFAACSASWAALRPTACACSAASFAACSTSIAISRSRTGRSRFRAARRSFACASLVACSTFNEFAW